MGEPGMQRPPGYLAVEHDDGVVHAVDAGNLPEGRPDWRAGVACGSATGVSSDEAGPGTLRRSVITCWECISLLDTGPALPPGPPVTSATARRAVNHSARPAAAKSAPRP